jgi:hypothetical protein
MAKSVYRRREDSKRKVFNLVAGSGPSSPCQRSLCGLDVIRSASQGFGNTQTPRVRERHVGCEITDLVTPKGVDLGRGGSHGLRPHSARRWSP